MKKFILSSLLVASVISARAFSLTFSVPATGSTNPFTSPVIVQNFTIANAGAVTNTLTFIDSFTNSAVYTNAFYTNYTFSVGNVTNIYTNWFGVQQSNVYQAQLTITNSVPANTNSFATRLVVSVPPSTTIQLLGNYYFYDGMFVTNNAAGAPTVTFTGVLGNFVPSHNP